MLVLVLFKALIASTLLTPHIASWPLFTCLDSILYTPQPPWSWCPHMPHSSPSTTNPQYFLESLKFTSNCSPAWFPVNIQLHSPLHGPYTPPCSAHDSSNFLSILVWYLQTRTTDLYVSIYFPTFGILIGLHNCWEWCYHIASNC